MGDILQKARDGKAWSANDLAAVVALPVSDIRRMERYELIPDDAAIQKLADALDLHGPSLKAVAHQTWMPQAPQADPAFEGFALVRLSPLSVMQVPVPLWKRILRMAR